MSEEERQLEQNSNSVITTVSTSQVFCAPAASLLPAAAGGILAVAGGFRLQRTPTSAHVATLATTESVDQCCTSSEERSTNRWVSYA